MLVTRCRLILHDTVYYATREMGTLYETERYLHNYALSYALFGQSLLRMPYHTTLNRPNYAGDLRVLNEAGIYVTPALPLQWDYMLVTWKMAEATYRRVSRKFGKDTGSRNFPVNYGRAKELAPESEFEFFVISAQPVILPRWIRLGKWFSKALVEPREPAPATNHTGSFVAASPINPLDTPGEWLAYDVISMPPVSLLINAHIEGAYLELNDGTRLPAGMHYLTQEAIT